MDNKITSSYRHSKGFYDNIMTRATWWSDLYLRIFWQNVDDVEIAGHVLDYIPDDFHIKGSMLYFSATKE